MKSDEPTESIIRVERKYLNLSKENILKNDVFGKIDTFPYFPQRLISGEQSKDKLDIDRSWEEYKKKYFRN